MFNKIDFKHKSGGVYLIMNIGIRSCWCWNL